MPFKLYTRAEFRDSIRRKMGIVPPIDVSMSNPAGAQPTNFPDPTNQQINDALTDAISDINRECGFHVTGFLVPVAAQAGTIVGPFGIYLGDLQPNTSTTPILSPNARVLDVLRVLWVPDSSVIPVLIQPVYRDSIDRSGVSQYYSAYPSQPQQWYVEGYVLYITPAQSETGKYYLTCGTGIADFGCDDGVIDQIPYDYQNIFEYAAIVNIAIGKPMDVEAQSLVQMYAPKASAGINRFKEWKLGGTGAPQPTMAFQSYRNSYGNRRVVR